MAMERRENQSGLLLTGSVIASLAASLCCILPVVAGVLGVSGSVAAAFFAPWRPYLLAATFMLLGLGFFLTYTYRRRAQPCEVGSVCGRPSFGRWNRALLWLATMLVLLFAAFPYYGGWVVRAVGDRHLKAASARGSLSRVVLKIDGMDCPVCAGGLQNNLRQIPGVRRAEVSFQDKLARIDYDRAELDLARFEQAVRDSGFKVAGILPQNR